ncbi:MAG: hypothetical protein COT22_02160 [Ignavibacteria bacterium CG08_land_8_20_14_0_20_37_9]|nr:MAG: hypothetical protein AUJ54_06850 [Ignavibacteria bacterium CG1_02_37_35]PIS46027.1 MAG: hypothetical protein COT22_02160 [Ignavibacteria bacterium CG08_land_8_20_14_0_20_37_9]
MKNKILLCAAQVKSRLNFLQHLKIALVVGTILNFINQYGSIIQLSFSDFNYLRAALTYVVPFGVSVYSAATIK